MSIIYCYTNKINGKKYIGQTIHPEQRKRNHKHEALNNKTDYYFHRAIRKYGLENFDYTILEENCPNLSERETHYIKEYNTLWPNGYNQLLDHIGMPDEIRAKISQTKKKQWEFLSEEEKIKRKEFLSTLGLGRKQTDFQKEKAAEANRKKWEIITPSGISEFTDNLKQYCLEKNIRYGNLYNTYMGYVKKHQGYILKQVKE